MTFVLSPFAALAITLFHFLITRKNVLAFGPYLCLGAVIVIFAWPAVWPAAARGFFSIGLGWFCIVVGGGLLLMPVLLTILLWIKGNPEQT